MPMSSTTAILAKVRRLTVLQQGLRHTPWPPWHVPGAHLQSSLRLQLLTAIQQIEK